MAGKKGSDELYRLIHSLSIEEKGYFKKFAKRHNSKGNIYLKLFDAISKQEKFEEITFKKKFQGYKDLKLYLKEMIMDAMVVYYKNSHSHISLFNGIQRIHFLLVKGLYKEAIKTLEKEISESRQMELFTVNKYLLKMLMELNSRTFNKSADLTVLATEYRQLTDENMANESNLDEFEILGLQWTAKRGDNFATPAQLAEAVNSISAIAPRSQRAEIRKATALEWIFYLQNDLEKSYNITKKQIDLVSEFREKKIVHILLSER